MKHHIGLTIDVELFREIERLRGMTKRSTYMEHLLRLGLKYQKMLNSKSLKIPEPIFNAKGEPIE